MIGTVTAVVKDVQPRVVKEGKPDQRTVYDIIDQAGEKFTAWEKPLAETAWNLKGQPSIWKVKVEQNGSYTNRTLMEITPNTGANNMMSEATNSFPTNGTAPVDIDTSPTVKDEMIHRQVATKVAAVLAKNEIDFWATVDILVNFYATGAKPGLATNNIQPQQEPAFTSPFEPVPDDDIPF